jgi:parallel beta-helix repeat protein
VDDASTLINCVADENYSASSTSYGISVGVRSLVSKCVASNNFTTNATPTSTTGAGINAGSGSTVQECLVSGNKGDGIRLAEFGQVLNNTASDNGTGTGDGAGIHILGQRCRVEGNHVTGNERGLEVRAIRNLIVRNSARSNGSNYVIVAGNRTAQIVVPALNSSDITSANNGSSDGFTAVDPWANFSF